MNTITKDDLDKMVLSQILTKIEDLAEDEEYNQLGQYTGQDVQQTSQDLDFLVKYVQKYYPSEDVQNRLNACILQGQENAESGFAWGKSGNKIVA